MRRAFLICYDIRDERRLRRVFRVCKGFGEHWQFSIFFAVLKPIDRVRLQAELEEEMNLAEDQCLIIDLGENIEEARERAAVIGVPLGEVKRGMVVV
jgi:CRISPR-associated protein Cas2